MKPHRRRRNWPSWRVREAEAERREAAVIALEAAVADREAKAFAKENGMRTLVGLPEKMVPAHAG
jgi:hypothetical protein